ncbi:hypothetical protein PAALTS15_24859 [Paenibacillus alvei TS-15]|uniref:Uncharacterized protein n=1 Tax=Paenibacillus alvei TS-15 TaxID=1117108 RepID=S9SF54_PAEAL|nr:hypothetical protein [Paenibacillus alvei]EPY04497.1 hypothetical protein PAALTS15_24859 [Paenibacillus alvei TS-15]
MKSIYRYAAAESEAVTDRQISMMEQGQLQGTAYFYVPKQDSGFAFIFSILAGVCFISLLAGRWAVLS